MQTRYSPVISVQAVNKFRKDARFDQVINRRVSVTGQQLPTITRMKTTHQYTLPAWEFTLFVLYLYLVSVSAGTNSNEFHLLPVDGATATVKQTLIHV